MQSTENKKVCPMLQSDALSNYCAFLGAFFFRNAHSIVDSLCGMVKKRMCIAG